MWPQSDAITYFSRWMAASRVSTGVLPSSVAITTNMGSGMGRDVSSTTCRRRNVHHWDLGGVNDAARLPPSGAHSKHKHHVRLCGNNNISTGQYGKIIDYHHNQQGIVYDIDTYPDMLMNSKWYGKVWCPNKKVPFPNFSNIQFWSFKDQNVIISSFKKGTKLHHDHHHWLSLLIIISQSEEADTAKAASSMTTEWTDRSKWSDLEAWRPTVWN